MPANSTAPLTGERQHYIAYTKLKAAIRDHILCGDEPILGICKPPIGGRAWKFTAEATVGLSHADILDDMAVVVEEEEGEWSGEEWADTEEYSADIWVPATNVT